MSQFVKPEEVNQLMGQETISARAKALGVLTKLSSSIPNAMLVRDYVLFFSQAH